jgi:hypothetical protein
MPIYLEEPSAFEDWDESTADFSTVLATTHGLLGLTPTTVIEFPSYVDDEGCYELTKSYQIFGSDGATDEAAVACIDIDESTGTVTITCEDDPSTLQDLSTIIRETVGCSGCTNFWTSEVQISFYNYCSEGLNEMSILAANNMGYTFAYELSSEEVSVNLPTYVDL